MNTRQKRILLFLLALVVLGVAGWLAVDALHRDMTLFYSPRQVATGEVPKDKAFRVGGMVKAGSLAREANGESVRFVLTDNEKDLAVAYRGPLPELFKEGKGAVVLGQPGGDSIFVASEVLAKHDEQYLSPEAVKAVSEAHIRAAAKKAGVAVPTGPFGR